MFQIINDPKWTDGLVQAFEVTGLLVALFLIVALVMLAFAKPINDRLSPETKSPERRPL